MRTSVTVGTLALLTVLVGAAATDPRLGAVIVAGCVTAFLLMSFGAGRVGLGFAMLSLFSAPLNAIRPLARADFVTFSDVFLLAAGVLLLPVLVSNRARLPLPWLIGSLGLLTVVLATGASSVAPGAALNYGGRLVAAAIVLPLFFLLWNPGVRTIDALAWSYVAGHAVSTAYAVVEGPAPENGRYDGLTTHFNYFGQSGLVALCLLVYLFGRSEAAKRRLLVYAAGLVCLGSVVMCGSRAALLVALLVGVLYPLLERSLISAYLLVAGGVGILVLGSRLAPDLGPGSALSRLQGDATTTTSDQLRAEAFSDGLAKFLQHPLLGNGFDEFALYAHNIYLQIAVGVGLVGLLAYLAILATTIAPLFTTGPLRRLGYLGLGYAAIGPLTNSLWDRFVWIALSLAILAAVRRSDDEEPRPGSAGRHLAAEAPRPSSSVQA